MELKTYQGKSMAEVLARVKQELGANAVILHTRTIRRGGVMGVGGRSVVEVTASSDSRLLPAAERRAMAGPQTRPVRPAPESSPRPRVQAPTPAPRPAAEGDDGSGQSGDLSALTDALRGEMRELRMMVRELLHRPGESVASPPDDTEVPAELQGIYTELLQHQVAEEIARDIIGKARQRLAEIEAALKQRSEARKTASPQTDGEGDSETDDRSVPRFHPKEALRDLIPIVAAECIERMLPPAEPVQLNTDGSTKYVAFVGPTGVGKTTTIAKLAAHFKLREKKSVGLITIDTYRIAAVDQLRAYADILELPLQVVLTPEDMRQAVEQMSGCDIILIDTAGRSQRNKQRLEELESFLEATRSVATRNSGGRFASVETHLVLSCTCPPEYMIEVAREFSFLGLDRVIFTKLDEAVGLGVILNVARRLDLSLSYLTTGQEVPDDIEVGHRRRVASLLLGQSAERLAEQAPSRLIDEAIC